MLATAGFVGDDLRRYSDREMLLQIEHDLQRASPLAEIGQEMNLIRAHRRARERITNATSPG